MIRVLVADDHAIVREGLKKIVVELPDIVVAGEAESGDEAVVKVSGEEYDLVLLDIAMPGRNWLDTLKQIKSVRADLPVLVLSIHSEEQYALRALRAGASGYLTKASAPNELIKAIRTVSVGKKYITAALAELLASHLTDDAERPLHHSLSDREYQVMCMIASGQTMKDIAEKLFLSVKTVSTYRSRILEKMRMKSNAELMQYAMRKRLVE